eukprot:9335390-Pyramimonas_sp.AAC.1
MLGKRRRAPESGVHARTIQGTASNLVKLPIQNLLVPSRRCPSEKTQVRFVALESAQGSTQVSSRSLSRPGWQQGSSPGRQLQDRLVREETQGGTKHLG